MQGITVAWIQETKGEMKERTNEVILSFIEKNTMG